MKISYLIDTDWVIDHFNNVKKVTKKLKELKPEGIVLSVISLAELYEWPIFVLRYDQFC
jgi:predicted nucleic acid-binding protein